MRIKLKMLFNHTKSIFIHPVHACMVDGKYKAGIARNSNRHSDCDGEEKNVFMK